MVAGFVQPFRYTGREYEDETGLYYYRARHFDPNTGRFLQEDPIWFEAGDMNVYRYVLNNPLNWTDPSGLAAAGGYGTIISRIVRPLSLGNIARAVALATAAGTAAYLSSEAGKNVLSVIGAGVACRMFTLASVFGILNEGQLAAADSGNCSASVIPFPKNPPATPIPDNDNEPICRLVRERLLPLSKGQIVPTKQCLYQCPNGEIKERLVPEYSQCPAAMPPWKLNPPIGPTPVR